MKEWFRIDGDNTLRVDYPLKETSMVWDVGGYKGEWSQKIYDRYKCKIWCFEPVFNLESKSYQVKPMALGGWSRTEIIHINKDRTGLICTTGKEVVINVVDVMYVVDMLDTPHIDLMKINIEGMEYELLERLLDADWVKNITDIQVQFHRTDDSDVRMKSIQDRLSETHYITYQYPYVWENWRLK